MNKPGFDRAVWKDSAVKAAKNAIPAWVAAVKEKYGEDINLISGKRLTYRLPTF